MAKKKIEKSGVVGKLSRIAAALKKNFVERDDVIDLLVAAILAEKNVLILGPPGTAKSAVVDAVCKAVGGGDFFRYLLTKFTTPDEIYGPRSVQGLKNDQFRRVSKGYLPMASVGFLDEVFKANSAVLNTLLTIMNERQWFDDGKWQDVKLRMVVGASNELPEGPELAALYDRFLCRIYTGYVAAAKSRLAILFGLASGKPVDESLTDDEINQLRALAWGMQVDENIGHLILKIADKINSELGITLSDRRIKAIYGLLPYYAIVRGESSVESGMLADVLPSLAWEKPDQRKAIYRIVLEIADPEVQQMQELSDAAEEIVVQLADLSVAKDANYIGKLSGARKALKDIIEKMLTVKGGSSRARQCITDAGRHYVTVMTRISEEMGVAGIKSDDMLDVLVEKYGLEIDGEDD